MVGPAVDGVLVGLLVIPATVGEVVLGLLEGLAVGVDEGITVAGDRVTGLKVVGILEGPTEGCSEVGEFDGVWLGVPEGIKVRGDREGSALGA